MKIYKEIKDKDLEFYINRYINNHLSPGEESAKVDKFEVNKDKVLVKYSVSVRIPYKDIDSDGYETNEYEYDTEYRTDEFDIKEIKK